MNVDVFRQLRIDERKRLQRRKLLKIKIVFGAVVVFLVMVVAAGAAEARHRHHRHHVVDANGNDPRPGKWCGWYVRQMLHVADRAFNRAAEWAHWGKPAGGPQVGAVVVWHHHVGIITGQSGGRWIVKSGNDGHRVRERERDLRNAIAFRTGE